MLTVHGQQHSFSTHERMFLWKCKVFETENVSTRGGLYPPPPHPPTPPHPHPPPTFGFMPNALTIWAIRARHLQCGCCYEHPIEDAEWVRFSLAWDVGCQSIWWGTEYQGKLFPVLSSIRIVFGIPLSRDSANTHIACGSGLETNLLGALFCVCRTRRVHRQVLSNAFLWDGRCAHPCDRFISNTRTLTCRHSTCGIKAVF